MNNTVNVNSKYKGNEALILNGKELPYTMLHYWQANLSEILLNVNRGGFAEFIVQSAMHAGGFDTFDKIMTGMEEYDLDGPEIKALHRRSKIEVKSAAAVQYDTPEDKDLSGYSHSKLNFSIRSHYKVEEDKEKDKDKDKAENKDKKQKEKRLPRNNDLYVFCHYTATKKSDNMLDMKNWDFYVYPTYKIEENADISEQKTISLTRIEELEIPKQSFEMLYREILRVVDEISEHCREKATSS